MIVKDYVRSAQLYVREMFIPLTHPPDEAQASFGEALVVTVDVVQKAHYLAVDLPHSDDCFVAAFPAETPEAFLEGHIRSFAGFGGVPTRILYENSRMAVAWNTRRRGPAKGAGVLRVTELLLVRRQVWTLHFGKRILRRERILIRRRALVNAVLFVGDLNRHKFI
jgi:hypothetical protein